MFTEAGGNLLADLAGYYLGTPSPAPFGPPTNAPSPACATPAVGFPTCARRADRVRLVARLRWPTCRTDSLALGFWNAGADGRYGLTTVQAVMAFQKWKGLPADHRRRQRHGHRAQHCSCAGPRRAARTGSLLEVDKSKQIAYIIQNGQMKYIFNVSTGNGQSYDEDDQKRRATASSASRSRRPARSTRIASTTSCATRATSARCTGRSSSSAASPSTASPKVPNYPASHGCVRVANPVMDLIWRENLLPLRSTVWIHD